MNKKHIFFALAGATAALGCSHEVESPQVSLSKIEPNLVCNAQRVDPDAMLRLTGTGFTPMPTNVLAEPTILVLPTVTVARSQDLAGNSASGSEVVFSGDPGEEFANNLRWDSSESMTLRVSEDPEVALARFFHAR